MLSTTSLISLLLVAFTFRLTYTQYAPDYCPVENGPCCNDTNVCVESYACVCPECSDTLQCIVCGYGIDSGLPELNCAAFNQSFETAEHRSHLGDVYNATWHGLTAVTHGPNNPILPTSGTQMGRSTTGTFVVNFTDGWQWIGTNVGSLVSFNFGCGAPKTKTSSDAATSCSLSVTALCVTYDLLNSSWGTYEYEELFEYTSPTHKLGKAPMIAATWTAEGNYTDEPYGVGEYSATCHNYTFVATVADGSSPFLYVDDVVGSYSINTFT